MLFTVYLYIWTKCFFKIIAEKRGYVVHNFHRVREQNKPLTEKSAAGSSPSVGLIRYMRIDF